MLNGHRGEKLQKLQNRIINNLFKKFFHVTCLYKHLSLLKIRDIYRLYCALHMYKIISDNSNPFIRDAIPIASPTHLYSTRNRNRFLTPFPRVDAVRFNFQYQFLTIWNEIPTRIHEARNLKIFRRQLTSYFLSVY